MLSHQFRTGAPVNSCTEHSFGEQLVGKGPAGFPGGDSKEQSLGCFHYQSLCPVIIRRENSFIPVLPLENPPGAMGGPVPAVPLSLCGALQGWGSPVLTG